MAARQPSPQEHSTQEQGPNHDLAGQVVIITGGSRGIGLAIAKECGARGASVVVASRKEAACEAAAEEIRSTGGSALGISTHVGDLDSLKHLADSAVRHFGGIDMLVNNAATPLAQPIGEFTPQAWSKSFDVNLRAPMFLFQECLPHLRRSNHAAVLNLISAAAFLSTPHEAMYGAAKTALLSFTRSMATQFAPEGIRVNALAPGTVDTNMTRNLGEEGFEFIKGISPMGRIAEPEEMVPPAMLLLTDAGSYITGQCLVADGGLVVAR